MKRIPKIKTTFIIWRKGNHNNVPRDTEVRRWIYNNGKRGTQYHVDEISETGEIQNTYIYKYTTEGPIFRKQIYGKIIYPYICSKQILKIMKRIS